MGNVNPLSMAAGIPADTLGVMRQAAQHVSEASLLAGLSPPSGDMAQFGLSAPGIPSSNLAIINFANNVVQGASAIAKAPMPSAQADRSGQSDQGEKPGMFRRAWNWIRGKAGAAVDFLKSLVGLSERNNPRKVREISNGNWEAWCAHSVCYALEQTLGRNPFGRRIASVQGILDESRRRGWFIPKGQAQPQKGDIFIQKSNGASHVGFVVANNGDGTVKVVAGNTGNAVREYTIRLDDPKLTGFARIPANA